jgi:hypothetical protein
VRVSTTLFLSVRISSLFLAVIFHAVLSFCVVGLRIG